MGIYLGREPYELISGAEKLIAVYGKWPDFHDAEVLSLVLDLSGIIFQMENTLHVAIQGVFGISARFQCSKAIVESVVRTSQ